MRQPQPPAARAPFGLLLALAPLSACAATLSTFQPAHVPETGHVGAEVGWDVSAPLGTISRVFDAAETLSTAANQKTLTQAERFQLVEAGANLALVPPGVVMHAGLAFVPTARLEVGLRWSTGTWRLGARYQLLDQEKNGIDLTAGLGVSRFKYSFPIDISSLEKVVKLDDFVRWSIDFPLLIGTHGTWYRLWTGPRILLSRFDTAIGLALPATANTPAEMVMASVDGTAAFVGGQGGVALGYKHLFVVFELTIVQLISTGHLTLAGQRQDVDLGGLVIYPGIGLMGEF